jgi:hypothetical protein
LTAVTPWSCLIATDLPVARYSGRSTGVVVGPPVWA